MDREKKIIKASIYGIIMNIVLVLFKAIVGFMANSIAIILDAVNNLTDAISAIVTIVGTKLAGKKADKEHPFGHGRIEYIASVIIAAIILFAGLTSMKESIIKIIHPQEVNYSVASLIVIIAAIIAKLIFGKYVKKVGEQLNSQSLIATGTDAFMDVILSISTLITAIINLKFKIGLEGYIGVFISIIIIKSSIDILKQTLNNLIGVRENKELSMKIKDAINSFEEVQETYDLTLHNYGPTKILGSAHIEVDDKMTAKEIYKLTRIIRHKLYSEFNIIMTIGIYAANVGDEYSENMKKDLEEIIDKYPEVIDFHGFYVDNNEKTVSFDIVIDFSVTKPKEIKRKIKEELKEKHNEYKYYVIIDNNLSE